MIDLVITGGMIMSNVDLNVDNVPMMFRASIDERCNLQFAGANSDVQVWKQEWLEGAADKAPSPSEEMKTQQYRVNW